MSDLKLKQAALERENLELRTSNINNNNNSSLMTRRPPTAPGRVGLVTSTPQNSPIHSTTPLYSSHGNLQQNSNPATPKVY